MSTSLAQHIARFIGLILAQVLIFQQFRIDHFIPFIYVIYVIIYPIKNNQTVFIFVAFLHGLCLDLFMTSGGIHAASCLSVAFIRPLLLRSVFGVSYDYQGIKLSNEAFDKVVWYSLFVVMVHHIVYFSLIAFSWSQWMWVLSTWFFSVIFSYSIILVLLFLLKPSNK